MKTIFTIITFLFTVILSAQTIESSSIDSGGASSENDIKVLYTIGEVNIQEYGLGNISLSEGFINSNITSSTLGVEDEDLLDQKIIMYPNPASEVLNAKSQTPIISIEIFDAIGRRILKEQNKNNINLSDFLSGTYFIKVKTNTRILVKKIIKI